MDHILQTIMKGLVERFGLRRMSYLDNIRKSAETPIAIDLFEATRD